MPNIDQKELDRLREMEAKQKKRWKTQNEHTAKLYDRINIAVPKGYKDKIKATAAKQGTSINAFRSNAIIKAVDNASTAGQPAEPDPQEETPDWFN